MIIGFNHNYYMRHDIQRTILASSPDAVKEGYIDEWLSRIHPIYAMLFALLSLPMELEKAKQKIANFFGLSLSNAHEILNNFLNNTSIYIGEYGNCKSYFPKYIIKDLSFASSTCG